MSMTVSGVSGLEAKAVRLPPRAEPIEASAPAVAREAAPATLRRVSPAADADVAASAATFNAHRVRQIVQQINAAVVYGASVSVVSTGTTIHATIDVSG